MKYFMVRTEESVASRQGKFSHIRTEILLARDVCAIYEDCLNRFGEHLISMDALEIDEKKIEPNTKIYVVM
jgi:hypothetical protein